MVRADNPPVWGEGLHLVEELRLGELDGPEHLLFGQVAAVAVNEAGTIFIADGLGSEIRRFAPDGDYLGTVGGSGGGPGEFFQITGMKVLPGGELAVWDPRNLRVSVFDSTGAFARSVRVTSTLFTSDPFQADTAGHFYVKGRANPGPLDVNESLRTCWIHVSADGEVLDSIPIPPQHPGVDSYVLATPVGYRSPFPESVESAFSPHGYMIVGSNSDYSLSRPLRDGRVLLIRRAYSPVPVVGEEKSQWEAWTHHFETAEEFVEIRRRAGQQVNYPPLPENKPAYRGFWVDQVARIWVDRYVEAEYRPYSEEELKERENRPRPRYEWREPPTWDVIDARGAFLGSVRTPERGFVAAAQGRWLWVVELGEFDEEYVVRYRIEPG